MSSAYVPRHDPEADLSFLEPWQQGRTRPPLLPRLLRLHNLNLTWWQRALFGDAPLALGVLIALADLATDWVIVALPLAVMAMVKLHDVIAGGLIGQPPPRSD